MTQSRIRIDRDEIPMIARRRWHDWASSWFVEWHYDHNASLGYGAAISCLVVYTDSNIMAANALSSTRHERKLKSPAKSVRTFTKAWNRSSFASSSSQNVQAVKAGQTIDHGGMLYSKEHREVFQQRQSAVLE